MLLFWALGLASKEKNGLIWYAGCLFTKSSTKQIFIASFLSTGLSQPTDLRGDCDLIFYFSVLLRVACSELCLGH